MTWIIYILRCADGSLYTGVTNNLDKRVAVHNAAKGAKYTLTRLPVQLVWSEIAASRSAALKREYEIKKLSRAEKIRLISQ
jgi:putative endonuclease